MFPSSQTQEVNESLLGKKINDERDAAHFKVSSPAYKNIVTYVDLLCECIQGTSNKKLNHKYSLENEIFKKCRDFLHLLGKYCDETDLKLATTSSTLRFGHVAFRDWFDRMKSASKEFVDELAECQDKQYKGELYTYFIESFGNRMRIDYGTGHELSFIIFTMGLCNLVDPTGGDNLDLVVTDSRLKNFVQAHGYDIHSLFAHSYLRLCRKVQTKFRLEPAGSRGVYNMDDFQYLPFLFGVAQLSGVKHISTSDFYLRDQVDQYKDDYIFLEAVDFILNNKRGPFNEHSYKLWGLTSLGSWDNIYRRIRLKFTDDILGPFPIIQHFLFGEYIMRWQTK